MRAIGSLITLLYPHQCVVCGDLVEQEGALCPTCWSETAFLDGTSCELCGVPLPGTDEPGLRCDDCLAIARPWDRGAAVFAYAGAGRRMVLALKHGDRADLAQCAGPWMARVARPLVTARTLIAPVPSHWLRVWRRRYNQAALLANSLAHSLGQEVAPDLFRRTRATDVQDGRSVEARFQNVEGAIRLAPGRADCIVDRDLLLVDDVMTSGATLAATAEAAHGAGPRSVRVVVLARVVKS